MKEQIDLLREEGKAYSAKILELVVLIKISEIKQGEDTPEMIANGMLAYRASEDAVMRLGKILQAMDGGKSIYDKK